MNYIDTQYQVCLFRLDELIKQHKEDDQDCYELIEEEIIQEIYSFSTIENVYSNYFLDAEVYEYWEIFENIYLNDSSDTKTLKLYSYVITQLW